ncbi:hypothetical protein D1920_16470 [Rhodopseudomonas palustris]|nr:hypothetical protein D1920_16470 [Rhodopseudomonas palustris]
MRLGKIFVMDNLGSHESPPIRRMIREAGPRLRYLPPYSPDLNPIEQVFAKIKHWMRIAQHARSTLLAATPATLAASFHPPNAQLPHG